MAHQDVHLKEPRQSNQVQPLMHHFLVVDKTRQKGLQSNSGPCFVFVCWHRGKAIVKWLPPPPPPEEATLVSC